MPESCRLLWNSLPINTYQAHQGGWAIRSRTSFSIFATFFLFDDWQMIFFSPLLRSFVSAYQSTFALPESASREQKNLQNIDWAIKK